MKLQEEGMLCHSKVGSGRFWWHWHKLKQIAIAKIPCNGYPAQKNDPSNTHPAGAQKLLLNSFSNSCNIGGGKERACHDFHEVALIILQQ